MNIASEEYAFLLRGVLLDPRANLPRLVIADYLEENGQDQRAEFVRLQVEEATLVPLHDAECRLICAPRAYDDCPLRRLWWAERRWLSTNRRCFDGQFAVTPPELWLARQLGDAPRSESLFAFARGFVSEVRLTAADFSRIAGTLFATQPVTRVVLTDRVPQDLRRAFYPTATEGFRWTRHDGHSQGVPDMIPAAVFEYLPKTVFPTPSYAHEAISVAAVAYGRHAAGLPPLSAPVDAEAE